MESHIGGRYWSSSPYLHVAISFEHALREVSLESASLLLRHADCESALSSEADPGARRELDVRSAAGEFCFWCGGDGQSVDRGRVRTVRFGLFVRRGYSNELADVSIVLPFRARKGLGIPWVVPIRAGQLGGSTTFFTLARSIVSHAAFTHPVRVALAYDEAWAIPPRAIVEASPGKGLIVPAYAVQPSDLIVGKFTFAGVEYASIHVTHR